MLDALLAEARLRWGLDAAAGVQIVPIDTLVSIPIDPARPLIVVPIEVLRATVPGPREPLPGRHARRDATPWTVLARLYPADHPVGRFGLAESTTVGRLADGPAGPIYLAPLDPEHALAGPWALAWIADRLRRPDGCPWDREQTHQSLRKHLLEESYEVYDALEHGASAELAGELGDLLLQVVLHAQLAAEAGVFDLTDVQARIGEKIVRRHPHVFGDAEAATATDVNRQWERIKAAERADEDATADESVDGPGAAPNAASALDGVSTTMPALAASQEMQERAAHVGYDWPDVSGVVAKVHEELGELLEARSPADVAEEVGDLLMVLVNLARKLDVQAEAALRSANEKFRRRFGTVEVLAAQRGVALRDLSFAELDRLWDAAKEAERGTGERGT